MKFRTLAKILGHRREQLFGWCVICGRRSFFFTKDAIERGHVRDSLYCIWCKSVARKRHVAKTILDLFAPRSRSLIDARPDLEKLSIYSAVANEHVHRILGPNNPNFTCSEFFPGVPSGSEKDGVICQDLEQLTFADQTFGLVITEDVLEHVRQPETAFKEIHRVLKTGGCHVFTIPFYFDRRTVTRVATDSGEDVHLLAAEYHGDTLRDKILVYSDFGYDLLDQLSTFGFETRVSISMHADAVRYGIADSSVFVSRKI